MSQEGLGEGRVDRFRKNKTKREGKKRKSERRERT
jgi:hypothetical protein